jgi:hypothetical protein
LKTSPDAAFATKACLKIRIIEDEDVASSGDMLRRTARISVKDEASSVKDSRRLLSPYKARRQASAFIIEESAFTATTISTQNTTHTPLPHTS